MTFMEQLHADMQHDPVFGLIAILVISTAGAVICFPFLLAGFFIQEKFWPSEDDYGGHPGPR